MQPSIASENTRKSFIRTFGILVRKPTSNCKVNDKNKQTNKRTNKTKCELRILIQY